MAEVFGIAASAISLALAFTTCVDCFEYIQLGRHFGRDFQTSLITLNCTRLRLSRWGQAVDIYNDPKLGRRDASPAEIQLARDALLQILALFAETEKISKRYKSKANVGDDFSTYSNKDMDSAFKVINNKMNSLAIQRKKGPGLLKATSWALYHNSEFKGLIENINKLVHELECLFPAPAAQLRLAKQEVGVVQDRQALELIENITRSVDSILYAAVKDAFLGHQYRNVVVTDHAQLLTGDSVSSDWRGETKGASHLYDGLLVGGHAKVMTGNRFGGKDFFDD